MSRTRISTLVILFIFATQLPASAVPLADEPNIVATPRFSPDGGTFEDALYVTVTCDTDGAVIHMTYNGMDPNENDQPVLSGERLYVFHDMTLKAAAWKPGAVTSQVTTADFKFVAPTPVFYPPAGAVYGKMYVSITAPPSPLPGASALTPRYTYTTNGMDPTPSDPCLAPGSTILVDHDVTLKARVWVGNLASLVATAEYRLAAAQYTGTGTEADPYIIATKADILQLSRMGGVCGKSFSMTADIDLTGEIFTGPVVQSLYGCTFDGGGHKITGLIIDDGGAGRSNLGFFGEAVGSRIVRLTIENCAVRGSAGSESIGALVGKLRSDEYSGCYWGVSYGCTSRSRPHIPLIADCHTSGAVDGYWSVGGLVGNVGSGTVIQCSSTAEVTGSYSATGGLVGGSRDSSIQNCFAGGRVAGVDYVGGLIGRLSASSSIGSRLRYCYSTGHVSGRSMVGGLAGSADYASLQIVASFWDAQTSGIPGGKTTAQMKSISTFLAAGWDFASETANGRADFWQMPAGGYPALFTAPTPAGAGTVAQPYIISTADELLRAGHWSWASFELGSDINLTGRVFAMAPIAPDPDPTPSPVSSNYDNPYDGVAFMGVLDGHCHAITGLTINDGGAANGYLGLFGNILDGTVRRLALENCSVTGTEGVLPSPNGSYYVGTLAGSAGAATIEDCRAGGAVTGRKYVGGLAGRNFAGNISRCSSSVNVSGSVGTYVGGLVGYNSNLMEPFIYCGMETFAPMPPRVTYGSIADSYASGAVSARAAGGLAGANDGKIARCYSTGLVTGSSGAGGLVTSNTGSVTASFWDMQTSGQAASAGGTGKTTAEMMAQATFAGWDFASVWTIDEGADYPRLARDVPKAVAGPDQTVTVPHGCKASITLDGSASRGLECRPLAYLWSGIIDGAPFASTEAKPVVELAPGIYTFVLIVNNGLKDSEPNACTVTVIENQLPIAEAGPDQVLYADHTGKVMASLDGSASSDPEGMPLSFLWKWNVAGVDCNSTTTSFTAQLPVGVYPFSLTVNDGLDSSAPDTCAVKVVAPVNGDLMLVPKVLNVQAHDKDIVAIFAMPGIAPGDLDRSAPVMIWPFGIQASRKMVFTARENRQLHPVIVAWFDTDAIMASTATTRFVWIQVETQLKSGRYAVGSDFVVVFCPPRGKPPHR